MKKSELKPINDQMELMVMMGDIFQRTAMLFFLIGFLLAIIVMMVGILVFF